MRENRIAIACALLVTATVAALVGAGGDFPLGDDWSYGHTVRTLCERGEIDFLPWTGASVLFQAAYGAALCKAFGFSFTILRISTLVAAALGAAGCFALARMSGTSRPVAAFAAAVLGFSPVYFNLAFTFMTDVPFTALAVWALYAYGRGLDDEHAGALWRGAILSALALLIRQHGVFVAAAATVVALADNRFPMRTRMLRATAAGAIPAAVFMGFHVWLFALHGAPAAVSDKLGEAVGLRPLAVADHALRAVLHGSILLLPIAVAGAATVRREAPRAVLAIAATLAAAALAMFIRDGSLGFYLPNVLWDFGIGAPTLRDSLFLAMPPPVRFGATFTAPLSVATVCAASVVLGALFLACTSSGKPSRKLLLTASLFLFGGALLHANFYFGRYLLPVLPAVIALSCGAFARDIRLGPGAAALALVALVSVAGTHDYMERNRARYDRLAQLTDSGVALETIDGGMDFNGWHLAERLGTWPTKQTARVGQPAERKSWWWVVDDRWVLSETVLDGYRVADEATYTRWLPPGRASMFVLEREPEP